MIYFSRVPLVLNMLSLRETSKDLIQEVPPLPDHIMYGSRSCIAVPYLALFNDDNWNWQGSVKQVFNFHNTNFSLEIIDVDVIRISDTRPIFLQIVSDATHFFLAISSFRKVPLPFSKRLSS